MGAVDSDKNCKRSYELLGQQNTSGKSKRKKCNAFAIELSYENVEKKRNGQTCAAEVVETGADDEV